MNSNKKVIFNYRLAQSKEDWETKFLSKLDAPGQNVGNNLLYLAATKEFGAGKESYKDFYTDENKELLIKRINDIANNPYNLRNHPEFAKNIGAAISQLDKEISKNKNVVTTENNTPVTETPSVTTTPSSSTGLTVTKNEDGTLIESNVHSADGDEIRKIFEQAKLIYKEKQDDFPVQWPMLRKQIIKKWDFIEEDEKIQFMQQLRDYDLKYHNMMSKQGGVLLKNGKFVAYTIDDLDIMLTRALDEKDIDKADDIRRRIQIILDENPKFMPDIERANKINKNIRLFNKQNPDLRISELK